MKEEENIYRFEEDPKELEPKPNFFQRNQKYIYTASVILLALLTMHWLTNRKQTKPTPIKIIPSSVAQKSPDVHSELSNQLASMRAKIFSLENSISKLNERMNYLNMITARQAPPPKPIATNAENKRPPLYIAVLLPGSRAWLTDENYTKILVVHVGSEIEGYGKVISLDNDIVTFDTGAKIDFFHKK